MTVYSTWPCAQPLPANMPLALRLSFQIERAVDLPPHAGAPLSLKLSSALSTPAPLPLRAGEPFQLQLALVFRFDPSAIPKVDPVMAPELDLGSVQPMFYAMRVNRQEFGIARLLRLPDGRWLARRVDLEEWRLRIPDSKPVLFRGEEHYPLDAFEGVVYRFDEPLMELELEIAPKFFAGTVLEGTRVRAAPPVPPSPGGFVNYDLFFNATSGATRLDGLFEAAVFNRLGVGSSGFLAQDVGAATRGVRLETAWRRDFAAEMKTLVIGDTIGSSGIWGRPVRFGGLSYGTNFATNPGFVTFPLPGLRGEAALPTTTELYVDGVLRQRSSVPPGPFRIDNLPVFTGQGEVRLVVRDLLGREQVIMMPYYASSQLLREGLTEQSNEVGAVRNNFGLRSNDYGRAVAAIQRRRGITDTLTGEARAELLQDQQTAGGGGAVSLPGIGVFSGAVAMSRSSRGLGELFFGGFERQVSRGVNFGLRSQWTTADFAQLGLQPGQRPPARLASGNISYSAGGYGSFGLAYVRQDNRDLASSEIVSASYTLSLGKSTALMVFGFKPLSGEGTHAVGITLSIGFGERSSGSLNYVAQPGANQAFVQVQQNPPAGSGSGYRVLAGLGSQGDREEAGWVLQTDKGAYVLEAGRANDVTAFRASASGAIALLDGRPFLARTLNDSFAVAHVPGFANVGVYLNNQIVARTDASGYAMLPRLLPYQANPVRIDTGDLPLDTQIDVVQLDAVPYFRSGLLLNFPVRRANGALVILVLDDGTPMPAGSVVNIVGREEQFPVAQRGEVYVTGLAEKNRLRARWRNQQCELDVDLGKELGFLPRIGPLACAGVRP